MEGILGFGGSVLVIAAIILLALTILLPVSAYSAQKYAAKCYEELRAINQKLDRYSAGGTP